MVVQTWAVDLEMRHVAAVADHILEVEHSFLVVVGEGAEDQTWEAAIRVEAVFRS